MQGLHPPAWAFFMSTEPIRDAIEDLATSPQSITVDGQTTSERSISELIEADKYLKEAAAAKRAKLGIRFARLIPPGPMGGHR